MADEEESVAAPPPPPASSRWNPTKEQITLLESLYRQGVRTPTAEQIQQIAGKLQEYGKIEGKNVFYWFQNHKARQRQKQKQESSGHFSKLVRAKTAPPPLRPAAPPLPGVLCRPCCMPQFAAVRYYPSPPPAVFAGAAPDESSCRNLELYDRECRRTLELFPLRPDSSSAEKPVDSLTNITGSTSVEREIR